MAKRERELWLRAHEMTWQHGDDAPIHAAMKADELFEKGDDEGAATWRLILRCINALQRPSGGTSDRVVE